VAMPTWWFLPPLRTLPIQRARGRLPVQHPLLRAGAGTQTSASRSCCRRQRPVAGNSQERRRREPSSLSSEKWSPLVHQARKTNLALHRRKRKVRRPCLTAATRQQPRRRRAKHVRW